MKRQQTKAELQARVGDLERSNTLLLLGLQVQTAMEVSEKTERATDDGWAYRLKLYRTDAAHGGIVIVKAECLTNRQNPSCFVEYLDDLGDRFTYEHAPNMTDAIGRLRSFRLRKYTDVLFQRDPTCVLCDAGEVHEH